MIIKRIIRLLSVAALVVLALAVPAFAQEDLTCRNANEDDTVRCDGELYELVDDNDGYGYNEYPWWGDPDESYNYPPLWGDPDESYDYPPLYGYGNESYYDEEAYEEAQEELEELEEAYEELEEAYGDWDW